MGESGRERDFFHQRDEGGCYACDFLSSERRERLYMCGAGCGVGIIWNLNLLNSFSHESLTCKLRQALKSLGWLSH